MNFDLGKNGNSRVLTDYAVCATSFARRWYVGKKGNRLRVASLISDRLRHSVMWAARIRKRHCTTRQPHFRDLLRKNGLVSAAPSVSPRISHTSDSAEALVSAALGPTVHLGFFFCTFLRDILIGAPRFRPTWRAVGATTTDRLCEPLHTSLRASIVDHPRCPISHPPNARTYAWYAKVTRHEIKAYSLATPEAGCIL